MILGENAAAAGRGQNRNVPPFGKPPHFRKGPGAHRPSAGEDDRTLRLPEQLGRLFEAPRVCGCFEGILRGKISAGADFLEANILGDIKVNRPRLAVQGQGKSPAHNPEDPLRFGDALAPLGDGFHQADLIDLLEGSHPGVGPLGAATDGNHRQAGGKGFQNSRDEMGHPRPAGSITNTGFPAHPGITHGHERTGRLLPHLDGFDFRNIQKGIKKKVSSGKPKNEFGFFRFQSGSNSLPDIHKKTPKFGCGDDSCKNPGNKGKSRAVDNSSKIYHQDRRFATNSLGSLSPLLTSPHLSLILRS